MHLSKTNILVSVTVLVLVLLAVGLFFIFPQKKAETYPLLVSPTGVKPGLQFGERVELEDTVRALGDTAVTEGRVGEYGIFFRDLNNGPIIALNEDADFAPASLLKLPVAIWYFRQEDLHPGFLNQEIEFTGPKGTNIEHYPASVSVVPGTTYTLRRLIELMLQYSDNDATAILTEFAGGRDKINEVYTDLGLKDVESYDSYTIDVHSYSAFFRVLFNAEYLHKSSSETLLEIMTHADFAHGLVAGLPAGVPAAHKFGERPEVTQLHDCGIVYAKNSPYSLCVMTRGGKYEDLAAFIASVSREVYNAVVQQ